uniref:dual-specificity kinase n=1 Tax=Panagrolaimus superbus TaxID=310955 RepID=A0A914ZBA5_9BILA
MLPYKRSRKYYHHGEKLHDVNQNVDDHCNIATTSYDLDCSSCSTTSSNQEDFSFSSGASPTRALRGSTRDAIGEIYGLDQFKVEKKLGEGFFGEVYKVQFLGESHGLLPKFCVMKVGKMNINIKKNARISAKKAQLRESQVLSELKHKNILTFLGMCVERNNDHWSLHLLVDYCDRGSLQQLIVSSKRAFPWIQRCLIALQISSAMAYVNSKGYMHRDLTAMNILLQSERGQRIPKAIVADFGLSTKIPKPSDPIEQCGTQDYMSPEMLLEQRYDEKSDVFSFGVILCQKMARIDADHDSGLARTKDFGIDFEEFIKIIPRDTPKDFFQLAFDCCKYNSNERPSFQELHDRIIAQKDFHPWKKVLMLS